MDKEKFDQFYFDMYELNNAQLRLLEHRLMGIMLSRFPDVNAASASEMAKVAEELGGVWVSQWNSEPDAPSMGDSDIRVKIHPTDDPFEDANS